MRAGLGVIIGVTALVGVSFGAQQPVPTKTLLVKNPPSGARKVLLKAKETASAATVVGDPTADGATLRIQLTPGGDQCVSMPAAGWSAISTIGFKYKDAALANGPVKVALIKKAPSGTFLLKALLKNGGPTSIGVAPGGPTVSYATNFTLGTGDEYCGGTATATPDPNDATTFKVSNDGAPAGCVAACNATTTSTSPPTTSSTSTTTSTTNPSSPVCCERASGCGGGAAGDCISSGGTPVGGGAVCDAFGNCSTTTALPGPCCQIGTSCGFPFPEPACTLAGGFQTPGFCSPMGVCVNPLFIFATSTQTTGSVSTSPESGGQPGLTGADNICATRAASAALPGTYRAWMSDSVHTAAARLTHGTVPYVLPFPIGTKVADDWTDLTDGTLDAPIDRSEVADAVSGTTWTGTDATGSFAGSACTDWTSLSAGVNGACGTIGATTASWTTGCGGEACSGSKRLYCVQQ